MPIPLNAQEYEDGKSAYLAKDYDKALKILKPLAESGHSQAQVTLGIMYDNGQGVPIDPAEAFRWYKMAAEQGIPVVQHQVAFKYLHGIGVEQNYDEAANWWQLSANAGLADSQFNLGLMYYRGLGIDQDFNKAKELFSAAAEQGHSHAQYSLAVMYAFGQGVDKDYQKALFWFRKSAGQDVAQAQFNLGVFYENGFGVERDLLVARKWYELASEQGLQQASEKLAQLDQTEVEIQQTNRVVAAETETVLEPLPETETVLEPLAETEAPLTTPAPIAMAGSIKREDWVLQQDPKTYTLQIGSGVQEQDIVALIKALRIEDNAAYIRVVVDGVIRYSALYGLYSSFAEAEQAIQELPENLQRTQPWIRNLGILQGMINDS